MDPITTAVVAALAHISAEAVKDGYHALKSAILRKFGSDSKLVKAVEELEQTPDSEGRRMIFQEEVARSKADQEKEIRSAAQSLIEKIESQPSGRQTVIKVTGDGNIAAGGNVSIGGSYRSGQQKK